MGRIQAMDSDSDSEYEYLSSPDPKKHSPRTLVRKKQQRKFLDDKVRLEQQQEASERKMGPPPFRRQGIVTNSDKSWATGANWVSYRPPARPDGKASTPVSSRLHSNQVAADGDLQRYDSGPREGTSGSNQLHKDRTYASDAHSVVNNWIDSHSISRTVNLFEEAGKASKSSASSHEKKSMRSPSDGQSLGGNATSARPPPPFHAPPLGSMAGLAGARQPYEQFRRPSTPPAGPRFTEEDDMDLYNSTPPRRSG